MSTQLRKTWAALSGIEIVTSPYVGGHKVVLHGPEKSDDPFHFTRKLSIIDLLTGTVSGNCPLDQVKRVIVSEQNKQVVLAMVERYGERS